MMKKIIVTLLSLGVVVGVFFAFNQYIYNKKQGDQKPALSPKDTTYVIEGRVIKLNNGFSEIESVLGSASKITTRYFGNEVVADLDKDGREDIVFLLTQETGGSGTFFYAVASLNKESGYEGSQGFLLGDRIAPQTTGKGENNSIIVNFAERGPGESFDVRPLFGKSIWLLFDSEAMKFNKIK